MKIFKFFLGLFLFSALAQTPAYAQNEKAAAEAEAKAQYEFEEKVREFILSNPEIIGEAIRILNERAEAASRESTKKALAENRELLEQDPLSIVLGNPEGDVTLVEFYDYRCPYCRESHADLNRLLEADPGVRLVLKQFPVKDRPGETPVSLISARLAMVARDQGVFRAFHNAMFEAEPPLTEETVFEIARNVGVDLNGLQDTMSAPEITRHIRETFTLASEIGATGTPTFVMGDIVIPGMVGFDILQQLVAYTRGQKAD